MINKSTAAALLAAIPAYGLPGCYTPWRSGGAYSSGSYVSATRSIETSTSAESTTAIVTKNFKCISGFLPVLSHCPNYDPSNPLVAGAAWEDVGECDGSAPTPAAPSTLQVRQHSNLQDPNMKFTRALLTPATTANSSALFYYPDFAGHCLNDGLQPPYMEKSGYLFTNKKDCCARHSAWDVASCMGDGSLTSGDKYYADWLKDDTCKNDGLAPAYMASNPTMWLHDTLSSCCARHYGWKMNTCMSAGAAATAAGSNKWYLDYAVMKCVQDCNGAVPCGGLANSWDVTFTTQSMCCEQKMWWDKKTCNSVANPKPVSPTLSPNPQRLPDRAIQTGQITIGNTGTGNRDLLEIRGDISESVANALSSATQKALEDIACTTEVGGISACEVEILAVEKVNAGYNIHYQTVFTIACPTFDCNGVDDVIADLALDTADKLAAAATTNGSEGLLAAIIENLAAIAEDTGTTDQGLTNSLVELGSAIENMPIVVETEPVQIYYESGPTSSPTKNPTQNPTKIVTSPSASTKSPTKNPTTSPSASTKSPTKHPTQNPTQTVTMSMPSSGRVLTSPSRPSRVKRSLKSDRRRRVTNSVERIRIGAHLPTSEMQISGTDPCSSAKSLSDFLQQERFIGAKKFASDNPVCPTAAHHHMHIAVPMYNIDESTLKAAITSIKMQNYPWEKVTVWVYDDGSNRPDADQVLRSSCDDVLDFAVPPDAAADEGELVFVALDEMGLSDVRDELRGGQVLCFRADRHLGAGGGKFWLLSLMRASSGKNDVMTILDGDDTLLGERTLDVINQKYVDTGSWFTYGSYEGRWSEQIVDLPASVRDGTEVFRPREQPWLYGHPRSFKAHLLDFLSADDFKFSDGSWLIKGTDRGFVYRMLELSGPDRIGYISHKIYQYNFSNKTSTLTSVSKEVRDAQVAHTMTSMKISEPLMPDVHVVLLMWKRAYLLKHQLDWLQAQKGLGGRRIHLHLVNNNPMAAESIEEAVELFRYASHGLMVVDRSYLSDDFLPMKVSVKHNSGIMHHNFARFVYVEELRRREQLDEVIFLDDDQFWPSDFISSLLTAHRPKSMTTWYGKTFKVDGETGLANYWAPKVGYLDIVGGGYWPSMASFTYGGTGGSIFDASLWLLDSQLMRLADDLSEWNRVDDLWASYVLDALLGWKIQRLEPPHMPVDIGDFFSNKSNRFHDMTKEYIPPKIAVELEMEFGNHGVSKVGTWVDPSVNKQDMFTTLQEAFLWNVHTEDNKYEQNSKLNAESAITAGAKLKGSNLVEAKAGLLENDLISVHNDANAKLQQMETLVSDLKKKIDSTLKEKGDLELKLQASNKRLGVSTTSAEKPKTEELNKMNELDAP